MKRVHDGKRKKIEIGRRSKMEIILIGATAALGAMYPYFRSLIG